MRVKTIAAVGALLAGLAIAILVAPVLWLAIDEAAVPPASDAPSMPAGVKTAHAEVHCGSGGCLRELTLSGVPTESETDIADSLGISEDSCSARSLLDRREVCASVDVVDGSVRLHLYYHRPLS